MQVEVKTISPVAVRIPDAVKFSGLSRSELYRRIRSGEIRAKKINSSRLVLLDSLREFIERLPEH